MNWKHFFLPHPTTHKKAHLLSIKAFVIYFLFFLVLQNSFGLIAKIKPGVLGISSQINYQEIIRLTNVERVKYGLSNLNESSKLDASAYDKGMNMFAEDYWAHYSPSGKDPWGFMRGEGYSFVYAGENLARNYYTAQDVVNAWMASPTHRDNILNPHYTDIGISVLDGTLQGQGTILIVQHFGSPVEYVAQKPTNIAGNTVPATPKPVSTAKPKPTLTPSPTVQPTPSLTPTPTPPVIAQANTEQTLPVSTKNNNLQIQGWSLDSYQLLRNLGLGFLGFIALLIAIDLYIMRRRLVHRITSHHLSHFALIAIAGSNLLQSGPGQILKDGVSIFVK